MDSCPNEILGLIFSEACSDDGRTGRSLSSVSRRVRCASRRYALQSVALYGHNQISTFAFILDQVDPEDRHVCHLYLTDRRRVLTEYPRDQTREEWLKERISEGTSANSFPPVSSPSAVLRILTTVGPTLQTLALLLFHRYEEPIFSDALHVPELRDLTIRSSILFRSTFIGPPLPPRCPRLQRLHVIQDFLLGRGLAQCIASIAPLLTHLRLSNVVPDSAETEGGILQDLERMVAQQAADDVPSTTADRFPSTLERVLVQLADRVSAFPSPPCHSCRALADMLTF